MNAAERTAFLNRLDPEQRSMAAVLLAHIDAETGEIEAASMKRSAGNADKLSELQLQLDRYDQQLLNEVTQLLVTFADNQLPPEERTKLIALLHRHEERITALERQRQVGEQERE